MKRKILLIFLTLIVLILIPCKVKALTIVLDAGHGAKDSGAVDKKHNISEKDINLKTTKYLKEYLEEYKDVNVILTRSDDTFLEIFDRSMIARNKHADLLISLHYNNLSEGTASGAEVFVTNNTSLPKYKEETSKLGNKILNNLNKLGIPNRGVKTRLIPKDETDVYSDGTRADYYGIIRYAMRGCKIDSGVIKPAGAVPANVQNGEGVPAIIIEHCFLNNDYDYQFYATDEAIKRTAKADADAIVDHYNLKSKMDDIVLGDINNDGKINQRDARLVLLASTEQIELTKEQKVAAEVNKDGKIDQRDARKILEYAAEIITKFNNN